MLGLNLKAWKTKLPSYMMKAQYDSKLVAVILNK